MFRRLSKDQLRELAGLRKNARRATVIRWLTTERWVFEKDANGWPIVSHSYAESRFGAGTAPTAASSGPNFDALDKVA